MHIIHKIFITKIWKELLQIKENNQCNKTNEQRYKEIISKRNYK